jgi:hypothetical protein
MKQVYKLRVLVGGEWPDEIEVIVEKEQELGLRQWLAFGSSIVLLLLLVGFALFAMTTHQLLLEKVFGVVAVGLFLLWRWLWKFSQ